jgi:hypothetical protein
MYLSLQSRTEQVFCLYESHYGVYHISHRATMTVRKEEEAQGGFFEDGRYYFEMLILSLSPTIKTPYEGLLDLRRAAFL